MKRLLGVLSLASVACVGQASPQQASQTPATPARVTAYDVDSALGKLFALPLWPNFDPRNTPVAIFDGETTVLFRHPGEPAGYYSLSSHQGVFARPGRDSLVNSNTSVTLAGVPTATVMLRQDGQSAREWAAVTAHEIFHVFQRSRHPSWTANEAELFTYPVDDAGALALRRAETVALRRALGARRADSVRCWTAAFARARRARFAAIGAAAAYERGTELNEGLANYVQLRALERPVLLPAADFPPEQVRARSYAIGAAIGQLLDRAAPAWRDTLESAPPFPNVSLDGLLERMSSSEAEGSPALRCTASAADSAAGVERARADVRALVAHREQARAALLAQPGWRVIIDADASPLFPQGFDPLNVSRVSATEVLHTRFLKLGNDRGIVELLGQAAVTEGRAGQHPLFNGVRRVTIPGLSALAVRDSSGVLLIQATGFQARLRNAAADTTGTTISVRAARAGP
ncbi:MAG: hypothetical protein ACJ8AD_19700 [Gemmatimonadaceae bacterium]